MKKVVIWMCIIMILCGIGWLVYMSMLPSGDTICKKCNYIVRDLDDNEYCTHCSAKLTEDNLAFQYDYRICSKCSTKSYNSLDKCCGNCGTELGEPAIDDSLSYNTYKFYSKIGVKFLFNLGGVVVALGLLLLYFIWYKDGSDEEDEDDDAEY